MHRPAAAVVMTVVWLAAVASAADAEEMARDAVNAVAAGDCVSCSRRKQRLTETAASVSSGDRSGEDGRIRLEEANEAMREHYRALMLQRLNITPVASGSPRSAPVRAAAVAAAASRISLPDNLLASFRDDSADIDGLDDTAEEYLVLAEDATAACDAVGDTRRRLCLKLNLGSLASHHDISTASVAVIAARLYIWSPRAALATSISSDAIGGPLHVLQLSSAARSAAAKTGAAKAPELDLSSRAVAVPNVGVSNGSGWLYYGLNRDIVRSSWFVGRVESDGIWRETEVVLEVTCYDGHGGGRCNPRSWVAADFGEHRPFAFVLVRRRSGSDARFPPQRIWRRDDGEAAGGQRRSGSGDCGVGTRLFCDDVPLGQQACCIERLKVVLSDFGLGQILEPKAFYPNYCRGSCSGFGQQIAYSQTYFAHTRLDEMKIHYTPCCVPTSTASVDVLYVDDSGAIRIRSMPHMVVEACGCM